MRRKCSFQGWATKNDLRCTDGRTIRRNAFASQDGDRVPLVWNHQHDRIDNVIGHADLENREEGVWAYCYLNDTPQAKYADIAIKHGDLNTLSIYANKLKQVGGDVLHGVIREVSLVLAGANPGAKILDTSIAHGDDEYGEAVIALSDSDEDCLIHYDFDDDGEEYDASEEPKPEPKSEPVPETKTEPVIQHAEENMEEKNNAPENGGEQKEKTIGDVLNTMNDEQLQVVEALVAQALKEGLDAKKEEPKEEPKKEESAEDDEDDEEEYMKHNVFDSDYENNNPFVLTNDDQAAIIADAENYGGSLKRSWIAHANAMGIDANALQHDADSDAGITRSLHVGDTGAQTYGVTEPSFLFPEAHALNTTPYMIQRRQEWVAKVFNAAKHVPYGRIKSLFADITMDEARAKGYVKGTEKQEEVFELLKRITLPTTVYKKQKIDRDDTIDITDFDMVAFIKGEMRVMLDEELSRAVLLGDGRGSSSNDKIKEDCIRPIWKDADLFVINKTFVASADTDEEKAAKADCKAFRRAAIKARKDYKGTGNPVLFTTADRVSDFLLMENEIGEAKYKTLDELAAALRVRDIVEVPVMEGQTRVVNGQTRNLEGIIVNMADYTIGADKGGAVSMFDDFDINFNQMIYLIETRCCGALTIPKSAIVIESVDKADGSISG
jgi:HK97 family phage prohead protease